MHKVTIKDILKATEGELICGNIEDICEDFERDSRLISYGKVYVAIKGENNDGNNYVEQSINNGAQTCIISCNINEKIKDKNIINKIKNNEINIIKVENTVKALQQIATYKRAFIILQRIQLYRLKLAVV